MRASVGKGERRMTRVQSRKKSTESGTSLSEVVTSRRRSLYQKEVCFRRPLFVDFYLHPLSNSIFLRMI